MQNSKKIIYSLRIFLLLRERGFEPLATTCNPNNEKLICWIYEKTPEFIKVLNDIIGSGDRNV